MACCLAIAFVVATLRRVPGLRRAGSEPSRAPQALRPAPGEAAMPVARPALLVEPRRRASTRPSGLLLGAALGTVLYTVIVALLFAGGVAESASRADANRLTFSASVLLVAAVGLTVAARRGESIRAARVAIGLGTALELLSLVEMHLLRPFELAGGSALADLAFHAIGPLIAVAGALLELRLLRGPPAVAIGTLR